MNLDERPRYMISVAADIERLQLIQRLTNDLGLNLAGVEHVLRLQDELVRMRIRLDRMEREMRRAISEVHRQYRRDLVPYKPPTDLTRTSWTSTS